MKPIPLLLVIITVFCILSAPVLISALSNNPLPLHFLEKQPLPFFSKGALIGISSNLKGVLNGIYHNLTAENDENYRNKCLILFIRRYFGHIVKYSHSINSKTLE